MCSTPDASHVLTRIKLFSAWNTPSFHSDAHQMDHRAATENSLLIRHCSRARAVNMAANLVFFFDRGRGGETCSIPQKSDASGDMYTPELELSREAFLVPFWMDIFSVKIHLQESKCWPFPLIFFPKRTFVRCVSYTRPRHMRQVWATDVPFSFWKISSLCNSKR